MPENGAERATTQPPKVETAERDPAAVMAEQADQAAAAAAAREKTETADPKVKMNAFLVEHDFFGVEPHDPEGMVAILLQMEQEYGLDITDEVVLTEMGMTVAMVGDDFKNRCETSLVKVKEKDRELEAEAEEAESAAKEVDAETDLSVSIERAENVLETNLKDELTLEGINSVLALKEWDEFPPGSKFLGKKKQLNIVKQELQAVAALNTLENPGDAAVLSRIVSATPVNWQEKRATVRYAQVLAAIDAGNLSDDTRRRAKEALGIKMHPEPDVRTATDTRDAFKKGRGTERVQVGTRREEQPPDSGNWVTVPVYKEKTIPYTEEDPVELAEGINAYPDPEHPDKIHINATIGDGRVYPFTCPASMDGSEATEQINFFFVNVVKEQCGITGATKQGEFATQGAATMDLSSTGHMTQAARIGRLTMDNMIGGFDTQSRFLDQDTIEQIRWGFQWMMPQKDIAGDAGFGDNSEKSRAKALGGNGIDGLIFGADGTLKEENYIMAMKFINGEAATGASEPDYNALVAHLEGLDDLDEVD